MTARTALSRAHILDSASELVAEGGLANASMRKLAARLGVTPMAIYRHFDNADALNAAMFDSFIREASVLPARPGDWQTWLLHVSENMYAALAASPHWLSLVGKVRLGSAAFEVLEACIEVFDADGFSRTDAVRAFFLMIQSVMGAVYLNYSITGEAPREDSAKAVLMLGELDALAQQDLLRQQIHNMIQSFQ
ncbi:MAG: TetR/AcrR family transcriptional regulator [Gammaproteobacteria bacterium]|nr:TetR/AcrR family transcriptional regulator [Gammaproteobacteria bacterium]NND38866.1 TetR/AcrR family transcriptional regulator [Pseudomonadales bacterium]MBT8152290.1 TetR/AcrR family transcriptional regulator [Gammaproteobacteria bacterium]NNL11946.1 TetR/AcrR family transcriptional regulator [Pseudomonadales bacterium]NNM12523.1 TetR/AcrR family transcriptional regulator [Pseudomonadales bacterium]